VRSVRSNHAVARDESGLDARTDGFLPDVEVAKPTDEFALVELPRRRFHATDPLHGRVITDHLIARDSSLHGGTIIIDLVKRVLNGETKGRLGGRR